MNTVRPLSFAGLGLLACAFISPNHDQPSVPKAKKWIPTFAVDVAPIIYSKCAACHHAGEVAPFALTNYKEAKAKAETIAAVAKGKYMPPWQAVSHGEFLNERTLTPKQIETLAAWADAGAPAGDLSKAPKSPTYTPGWLMGTPDFVGKPDRSYTVSAEGTDEYRCFVIPTHLTEDKWVTGIELRPGNHKIVHHVLVYIDTSGAARKMDGMDGKPGYSSFGGPGFQPAGSLGGWAPGLQPQILRPGTGFLLPKGSDIVFQMHYHKDGKEETDLTSFGLKFSKETVDKKVRWQAIGDELLEIPAGANNYPVHASLKLPRPITVLDVIPHMHLLGKDMLVVATLPDGSKKTLIDVPHYDYNWQTRYSYRDPVALPAGTVLTLDAHYDNSANNIHNPNTPPKKVTFGEQTTDEMCFAFFSFTVDEEHLAKGISVKDNDELGAARAEIERIFDKFDVNHDGFLDVPELTAMLKFFEGNVKDSSGKAPNPDAEAKMAIAFFGKTQKGKVTKDEFVKMAKYQRDH